jgi:hypothetical protein
MGIWDKDEQSLSLKSISSIIDYLQSKTINDSRLSRYLIKPKGGAKNEPPHLTLRYFYN